MLKKHYKNDSKPLGNKGEDIANKFLIKKGYKILERNFRFSKGEIDIIAQDKNEIIFIEVKTRRNMNYGNPIDSVTINKKKHIYNTANYYLYINKLYDKFIRFDVIEDYILDRKIYINHIKNIEIK